MAMMTHSELGAMFGPRLKEARMNAGLSEDELGAKVYATERSIKGYENGIVIPNLIMVFNLAKVLKVPVGWLLAGEEAAQPKWISVKERLPEKAGKYIVCTRKKAVYCTAFRFFHGEGYFATDSTTHITHWMPLPEPPEEDAHE